MKQTNLEPALVWSCFEEICKVPRPSYKTQNIQNWLLSFAQEHRLEGIRDVAGNVIIRKKATPGKENAVPVILQTHIDMVCEKNKSVQHDFEKDPIEVYIEDDWMKARGTTLGADDGIGMALSLAALISDEVAHGPIECLFTVDEEVGLIGASALEKGLLQGKALINLDSEDDGSICIGCAGGINTTAHFRYNLQPTPQGLFFFKLSVSGLKGGHSGSDIICGRANANQLLARFLYDENTHGDLYLSDFLGGNLSNAIPREAICVAGIPFINKEELRVRVNMYEADLKAEFRKEEPSLTLHLESTEAPAFVLEKAQSDAFISAMYACPNGVIAMSREVDNMVETSSNLASVKKAGDQEWSIVTSQRSSIESSKEDIAHRVSAIFEMAGMTITHNEGYPGWAPNPNSNLLKVMSNVYREMFAKEPVVYAIHAGLECGLLVSKYPDLDMVSIGPTMQGVHSPDERLYIPTVANQWKWLVEVLKRL